MKKILITLLAVCFCFLAAPTETFAYGETALSTDWQAVNLSEIRLHLERDNTWEETFSFTEDIFIEGTSDGYYRFNYKDFSDKITFSNRDWSCYQVDWVIWENKENKTVYDQGSDSFVLTGDYYTFSFVPLAEINDMPFDLYFYFEVKTYETKVNVVNNVNNQTATIVCDYVYDGDKIKTRISSLMFSKTYGKSFYYLFDTPGYMFSGKSNYTLETGYLDYYVYTSDQPGITLVLEYEKPFVVFSFGEKQHKAEMSAFEDGYAYTVLFDSPIEMTSAKWDELRAAVVDKNIVQDNMLTEEEYSLFSSKFNTMLGIDKSFRIDGFETQMPIAFIYKERWGKEKYISLEGLRFELGDKYQNNVEILFTDETVIEREPTTGENINNWFDDVKNSTDGFVRFLKIVGIACLCLVALWLVVNLLKAFVSIFKK